MTPTEHTDPPPAPLRMWSGWDAPDEPPARVPRAPGMDSLDPPALIERLASSAPEPDRTILREYLQQKHDQGLQRNSLKGMGMGLSKLARALNTSGANLEHAAPDELALALTRLRDDLSATSHQIHVAHARAFYRWLHNDSLPRAIASAAPRERPRAEASPRVLTRASFDALLVAAEDLPARARTRAMLWLLWDTGITRGELFDLRLRDLALDADGSVVLNLATDPTEPRAVARSVALTEALRPLAEWILEHPAREDPDASLWPSPGDARAPILPGYLNTTLARLAKRAGLPLVAPKHFRDTRIARAVAEGWQESRMRTHFGWSPTSTRPAQFTTALPQSGLFSDGGDDPAQPFAP